MYIPGFSLTPPPDRNEDCLITMSSGDECQFLSVQDIGKFFTKGEMPNDTELCNGIPISPEHIRNNALQAIESAYIIDQAIKVKLAKALGGLSKSEFEELPEYIRTEVEKLQELRFVLTPQPYRNPNNLVLVKTSGNAILSLSVNDVEYFFNNGIVQGKESNSNIAFPPHGKALHNLYNESCTREKIVSDNMISLANILRDLPSEERHYLSAGLKHSINTHRSLFDKAI